MAKKKIIIIGGGGHAKVLIDLIKQLKDLDISGILDPKLKKNATVSGASVLGSEGLLDGLYKKGVRNLCVGVGKIGSDDCRKKIYEKAIGMGFNVPCLVHPRSIVAKDVQLGAGVQVMAGVVIQTATLIGENTIINTGSIIDHDCVIGKHVHICPGAVVSGGCAIGDGSFVGAGAVIVHGINIGKNVIIGAGAVVINDVPDQAKVKGVPAQ